MSLEFVTPWDLLWSHLGGFPSEYSPIPLLRWWPRYGMSSWHLEHGKIFQLHWVSNRALESRWLAGRWVGKSHSQQRSPIDALEVYICKYVYMYIYKLYVYVHIYVYILYYILYIIYYIYIQIICVCAYIYTRMYIYIHTPCIYGSALQTPLPPLMVMVLHVRCMLEALCQIQLTCR